MSASEERVRHTDRNGQQEGEEGGDEPPEQRPRPDARVPDRLAHGDRQCGGFDLMRERGGLAR
jgi:hypothetical protein